MSDAGRRWAETAQVRRPLLLRWYRIAVAVFVSIWFGWDVVHGLLGSQPDDRWAVLAGLVVGWASFAALSVGWERLSPRWARWLLGLLLLEMALIVPMLFEGDLVARSFAGAFMICFVCAVLLASFTGRPKGLAAGFANRKLNRHDAYIKRRAAAERSFDITGRPPLITAFPIPQSDQLALMALADELRRARRRFRRGPSTRGRLLFVGGDALGKAQLGVSIAYRAGSSLLRMDWAEWDPDGDGRAAFTEAFTLARQRRDGVVVMNGGHGRSPAALIARFDWRYPQHDRRGRWSDRFRYGSHLFEAPQQPSHPRFDGL